MQAHLAQLALGDIYAALEVHQDQSDLQAKGLVALGVLGQVRPKLSSLPNSSCRLPNAMKCFSALRV